jgi:hypothetical protein
VRAEETRASGPTPRRTLARAPCRAPCRWGRPGRRNIEIVVATTAAIAATTSIAATTTSAATATATTAPTTIVVKVVIVGAIRGRLRSGQIVRLRGRATRSQERGLGSVLGVSLSGGLLTQDEFVRLNECGEF